MNARILLVFVSFFWLACNDGKKAVANDPAQLPPQYYYYPRANVYFDSANKNYLFLTADSSGWKTARQVPAVVHNLMDKGALIQNPAQPVWKDNDKHKLIYSALLYATPNDTVETKEPKPVVKKQEDQGADADSEKKKRSGLKKIIDKLFGGLKKKRNPK